MYCTIGLTSSTSNVLGAVPASMHLDENIHSAMILKTDDNRVFSPGHRPVKVKFP